MLFALKSDLKFKIDEKNVKFHQKGKQPTLYNKNEMPLSKYLNNNKYIQVKAYKISCFDFNQLKSNMFANSDLLNAFIALSADGILNIRFYFFI
jgi:hypothetical protein